ncbi:MAG: CRISPR-associated endonuclease Cas2 [Candidatus Staskawiczbacteria bacterium RIFCSPHIGHO2_02_FULL_34_9]|uniref:CRISPR-associated endonuclease Cas2 n=1 Tax=Candidatus Staskawiczbacteria bacterium RIFCSPHIGHO2_02_FULL_34_9 TaxID=1802206 RepID=A0A1G2I0U2_9BACT|nr:MAG: CRISPR-associated endonuclease Cas2 [Candidatus Staskawiczbacteria bacterium RIFCSPHIGHO2_02_FULL_34_9]
MKIPITDQFLLDVVYKFVDKTDDVVDFLLSNKYRQINIIFGKNNPEIEKYKKNKKYHQFNQLIYNLKKNNYIKVKNLENKKAIIITKAGIDKALKASFKIEGRNKKNKRKDNKWIMIIFDIPQKHRKARDLLRSILNNLGYKMFQQSVWITPYDVSDKTEKLLQAYSLDGYVKIFIVEKL